MTKLSKYEKETIINWNEAENLASIYAFNASLKRRLADFQPEVSAAVPAGAQHAGGQCDLCAGQVPAVDPAGAAVQRGTESRCKGVRKGAWLSGDSGGRKNRLKSGRLRSKCRVCTRCFDRQSPQAYSVSTSHLWAQMCGYGAGETGKNRSCGGSQLRRYGSTEGSQPFVPGCRGGSALLGSRGNAHWRVEGSRPSGQGCKRLAQGELMPASTRTGYYLTQNSQDLRLRRPFPGPRTSSQEGGNLFETDTTQWALRQAWHL